MSISVERQAELLRKQCHWQRLQGTSRHSEYPYGKHVPDCDICRSADLLEKLEADSVSGWRACIDHIIRPDSPCPVCKIEELEEAREYLVKQCALVNEQKHESLRENGKLARRISMLEQLQAVKVKYLEQEIRDNMFAVAGVKQLQAKLRTLGYDEKGDPIHETEKPEA